MIRLRPAGSAKGRIAAQPRELHCYVPEKGGVIAKIALPEARGVLHGAMRPLESGALNPRGAIANATRVVVKGRAYADEQRRVKLVKILRHEPLLLRCAEPNPYDVRL